MNAAARLLGSRLRVRLRVRTLPRSGAEMQGRPARWVAAGLVVLAAPWLAAARAEPATRAVTFAEAMERAQHAPSLDAAEEAARGWRRAAETAESGPSWQLTGTPGLDEGGALRWQAEAVASLGGGRGAAARASGRAAAEALARGVAGQRKERRRLAAAAWLATWSAAARLAVAEQEQGAARELAQLARRARALGAGTAVEEAAAEAYLAEVELARLAVEGELTERGLALAEALGDDGAAPLAVRGELPDLEVDGAAVATAAAAATAEAMAAARRAREAAVQAQPQLQLGLRAEDDGVSRAGFVVLGLALPGGDRGALARAAARAELRRLEGAAEELERRARLEQARARHEVEHARELWRGAEARAAALARQVAATEAARAGGEALLSELVLARRGLLAARAQVASARADEARARVERALAAGWGQP